MTNASAASSLVYSSSPSFSSTTSSKMGVRIGSRASFSWSPTSSSLLLLGSILRAQMSLVNRCLTHLLHHASSSTFSARPMLSACTSTSLSVTDIWDGASITMNLSILFCFTSLGLSCFLINDGLKVSFTSNDFHDFQSRVVSLVWIWHGLEWMNWKVTTGVLNERQVL